MIVIKRRKRDKVMDEPYDGGTEVGMKVGMADKSAAGWRQPLTIEESLKSGKTPLGKEKGYQKGKETKSVEV